MFRLLRESDGQSMVMMALFLLFVGILLLGFIGMAVVYAQLAEAQAAADAAALTGARQALIREIKVGGNTICRLAEIDVDNALQAATQIWNQNVSDATFQTSSVEGQALPASRPTRFGFRAFIESRNSALALVGIPLLQTSVYAEAELLQDCNNTLTGPVFSLSRPLPSGWPIPEAEWVWNFPAAEQNAPVGWPVYFVKTFNLADDGLVHIYAAADADYEIGIDDEVVLQGSGPDIASTTVSLAKGPHMIWIRAINPAPNDPFMGPNPAGIVVGVRDEAFNVLAVTKGNPITNAGKPETPDDWSSWSPPNPDWTVYADPFYPSGWIIGAEELVSILKDMGFTHRNAADLRSWMLTVLGMGRAYRTVTVMAQDVVPDTIAATPDENAILRHYLNGGGNVLWIGNVPLYTQGHADGSKTDWGTAGQEQVLGLPNPTTYWYTSGDPMEPEPTDAGQGYGIGRTPWWEPMMSGRAVAPYCWLQPLATISSGGVSAWRMSYWPLEPNCDRGDSYIQNAWRENAPGFVRLYDAGVYLYHPPYLVTAMTVAGQMAGWYRGQTRQ